MLPKPNQNHKLAQNYRPISLLCATAKIYEKIILNRIKQHCDTINCIPPEQCGFRNNHSTTHQLIRVTNIINEGYTYKFFTVGVFLDVKRAFDKMWHDGRIYKMIKLNFPEYLVKIIHNFLKNRSFRVKINFDLSNKGFPEAGCPQGSCLSPYLYNIYTYDFPHHPSVSICLFADDAAVLAQGANLKYTQCTLQRYLHTLESWLTDWRIAINVDKTQAIVFRKHGRKLIPKTLSLFDEDIEWLLLPSAIVRVVCRSDRFSQFRVWLRPRRVLVGFASSCCPAPPQFWASFSCWPPSLLAIHSEQKRPLAVARDRSYFRSFRPTQMKHVSHASQIPSSNQSPPCH
ncbi:RNA-directed DNA polymerase from mobile element jockey [Trichonephila clavipes]|nr:RNA-directed DNA polymerase from mobile element jockey [Trichonephila clavipes]